MNRFLAFLGLKIVEIAAIVYVPYWVGVWDPFKANQEFPLWVKGVSTIFLSAILIFCFTVAVWLLLHFLNLNWKWTHSGKGIKWIEKILEEG